MIQLAEPVSGTLRAVQARIFTGSNDISQKLLDSVISHAYMETHQVTVFLNPY